MSRTRGEKKYGSGPGSHEESNDDDDEYRTLHLDPGRRRQFGTVIPGANIGQMSSFLTLIRSNSPQRALNTNDRPWQGLIRSPFSPVPPPRQRPVRRIHAARHLLGARLCSRPAAAAAAGRCVDSTASYRVHLQLFARAWTWAESC